MKEGGRFLCCCYHWNQWVRQEGRHGGTGKQRGAKYLGQAGRIWIDTGGERWNGREGGKVWFGAGFSSVFGRGERGGVGTGILFG